MGTSTAAQPGAASQRTTAMPGRRTSPASWKSARAAAGAKGSTRAPASPTTTTSEPKIGTAMGLATSPTPETREARIQRHRPEARQGRHALDVDRQHEPLAAGQQPADHREPRRRHEAHVQAGDREDVDHAGAAEGVAQLGVDLALLADDER